MNAEDLGQPENEAIAVDDSQKEDVPEKNPPCTPVGKDDPEERSDQCREGTPKNNEEAEDLGQPENEAGDDSQEKDVPETTLPDTHDDKHDTEKLGDDTFLSESKQDDKEDQDGSADNRQDEGVDNAVSSQAKCSQVDTRKDVPDTTPLGTPVDKDDPEERSDQCREGTPENKEEAEDLGQPENEAIAVDDSQKEDVFEKTPSGTPDDKDDPKERSDQCRAGTPKNNEEDMPETTPLATPNDKEDTKKLCDVKFSVETPQKDNEDRDGSVDSRQDKGVDNVISSQVNQEVKCSQVDSKKDDIVDKKDTERRSSITQKKESTTEDSDEVDSHRESSQNLYYIYYIFVTVLIALLAMWLFTPQPSPDKKGFDHLEVFHNEMKRVQSSFPNQCNELWRRSRIHIKRHLEKRDPSEPVSLILTSGHGAERTLGCLARRLAAAFSNALNTSVLNIDGTSKTEQDSDQVKMDIDRALREAFEGGKYAAVIHRFEELPPASTLIFYRYCDHENAAYKNVFLAFTVMLERELELPPDISLGVVEEAVQEHLKQKFVSSDRTAKFNQMDVDKLSGLWSRISHLILPVAAEQRIEQHGCEESG